MKIDINGLFSAWCTNIKLFMHLSIAFFFPCMLFMLSMKYMSLTILLVSLVITPFIAGCIFVELNSFFHLKSELKREARFSILQVVDHKSGMKYLLGTYFLRGVQLIIVACMFIVFSAAISALFFLLPLAMVTKILFNGGFIEGQIGSIIMVVMGLINIIILPFILDMVFKLLDY